MFHVRVYTFNCVGRLVEAYDELGNRYVIPKYCISKPLNMAGLALQQPASVAKAEDNDSLETDSSTQLLKKQSPSSSPSAVASGNSGGIRHRGSAKKKSKSNSSKESLSNRGSAQSQVLTVPTGDPVIVKIRVSTLPKDIKMTVQATERVRDVKRRLEVDHKVPASHVTMLYSGRVLSDRVYIKNLDIPKGFIIQAIVND